MIKTKVYTREYTLDENEAALVKICLDYAYHRVAKHCCCGISHMVAVEEINELRNQF